MFKHMRKKRNSKYIEAQQWFDELDADSQQDTTVSYLRKLSAKDYKKFLEAMELYRQGDVVIGKVKDVENPPETDLPPIKQEDNQAKRGKNDEGNKDTKAV